MRATTELPPGTTRFEVEAEERAPSSTDVRRLVFSSDAGLVDVRPASERAVRHMPLFVRLPQLGRD
jgi:hypothetical protein